MSALSAGTGTDRELIQAHRQSDFQNLRIGQPTVGHVGLHRASPVMVGPGARTARNRLIILVPLVAECEIVHRPLAGRQPTGGSEQGVRHNLARFDIAGDDGRRIGGFEHRAVGHDQFDWAEATVVHRYHVIDQRADDIQRRRPHDREWRVEIIIELGAGTGEIERRRPRLFINADDHPDGSAIVHRTFEFAIIEPVEQPPHRLLRVGEDVVHIGRDNLRSVIACRFGECFRAANAGGQLGPKVGDVAILVACGKRAASEQLTQLCFAESAFVDQQLIVDEHAFLIDRPAVGRHRSGRDAAYVRVMAPRGDEGRCIGLIAVKHRNDHGDVRQMRPASIGIIEHIGIAAPNSAPVA